MHRAHLVVAGTVAGFFLSTAHAGVEWATWGAPGGATSTGAFPNGSSVVLTANFTGISGGVEAGAEYTADPLPPGRPDGTNPPFTRMMTGTPGTDVPNGAAVLTLDLTGLPADAKVIFGLADQCDCYNYRMEVLDGSLGALDLASIVVKPYNITYLNPLYGSTYVADYNSIFVGDLLYADQVHDGGSDYGHTGLTTFAELPAGARYIKLYAPNYPQGAEGLQVAVAVEAGPIVGTSGNDVLNGTDGDDEIRGLGGNDTIDGKGGADTMKGGPGNDTMYVDTAGDKVIELSGQGTDTVRSKISYTLPANVEKLVLIGTANRNGTGNSLANTLTGNAGNNVLNGRTGADAMIGKAGNDTYIVDHAGDAVTEASGEGADLVKSSVAFTLPTGVENLTLTGVADINGTGNGLANVLTGNGGNNVLSGRGGNDTLKGCAGADKFLFNAPLNASTNTDKITDFSPADDAIRLDDAIFAALPGTGTLPASAFAIGVTATTAAHRILYDPATGNLRYDADGNGPAAAVRFATLTTKPTVTELDFIQW
jgi:Ca2+-binding RTX toxin-like protein